MNFYDVCKFVSEELELADQKIRSITTLYGGAPTEEERRVQCKFLMGQLLTTLNRVIEIAEYAKHEFEKIGRD